MAHQWITPIFASVVFQLATFGAAAQSYPEKTIRLVVPYGVGGSSDIVGRIVAQRLSEQLGKNLVVDNRPGAAGVIGTEAAARSAADGYTLLIADAVHSSVLSVYPNAGFHPIRDFVPISLFATTPMMLAVHPSLPARSVTEFIALARKQPNQLMHASGGTGSIGHLTAEYFKQRTGVKMVHVPYKGGGQSIAETVAGQIPSVFVGVTSAVSMVKAGRLRGLGVAAEKRSLILPAVPTFEESGIPDFRVGNWFGVLAPAGTPQPIVSKLRQEIVKAAQTPAARSQLEAASLEPVTNTPDEFRALIDAEATRWSKVIKDAGVRTQ